MSYIPPLVCDTPPPIDFEDSHEDDFGDGIFSNYDGSSLPSTPKQTLSINDQYDLPVDISELPESQKIPLDDQSELGATYQDFKDSKQFTQVPLSNIKESQSCYLRHNEIPPPLSECNIDTRNIANIVRSNEIDKEVILETSLPRDSPIQNIPSNLEPQSPDNSSSSHLNDNVCRSESPPSLVFSGTSINCDEIRSEDFDDFRQNIDDVECHFPSLKLDLISDTKSQSSDLEDTNSDTVVEVVNEGEKRILASRESQVITTSDCDTREEINTRSSHAKDKSTILNQGENFDDFVEYKSTFVEKAFRSELDKDVIIDEKVPQTESDQCEQLMFDDNNFAADFSQFEVFSDIKPDVSVARHRQEIKQSVTIPNEAKSEDLSILTTPLDDFEDFKHEDDDDEFGEFNDFSNFYQPPTSSIPNIEEMSAKIKPLLDTLFPISDNESEDSYNALDLSNDITIIMKDFENSKALDHQWLSSVGKSSLVTALGIDSRNILYGGKWNNSMPRFAANLGFSPLEPLKSSNVSGTTSSSTNSLSNEIPAAQFDWNSSGLVNPLDGVQEILHKANIAENQSSRTELDWHSTKAESSIIAPTPSLSSIHTTLNNKTNNFISDEETSQTSASYVVPGSSGTLKETHIFTPSKTTYLIPQSRDDKHETKCPDFDYEKAAAGIIIDENVVKKEYRDVEYNPNKPATSTSDDFSEFQSVSITGPSQKIHKQHQHILPIDFGILQPTKPNDVITINWPDPGNVVDSTESYDNFTSVRQVNSSDKKRCSIDFGFNGKSKSPVNTLAEFAKPVIGISPSELMFATNSISMEDEFSDFQCVEPISSYCKHPDMISPDVISPDMMSPDVISPDVISPDGKSPDVILTPSIETGFMSKTISDNSSSSPNLNTWNNYQSPLSIHTMSTNVPVANIFQPALIKPTQILTPQPVNPQPSSTKSIWPESEIDPQEIARLEAIFPQIQKQSQLISSCSLQTSSRQYAIPQPTFATQEDDEWSDFVSVPTPALQPLPITNIISANIAKHQQDDDEWTDFVSSTSQSSIQPWNINSGPNFPSWNAPPQFNSWQSSTLYPSTQQFLPTMPAVTNNTSLPLHETTLANAKSGQNSCFTRKAPSISLIPDLGFVAPKTFVNRSRTNFQSK